MKVLTYSDYHKMCRAAADLIVAQIKRKFHSLLCFPSGESPAGVFKYLIDDANEGRVDFSGCYFAGLDEWVGMGKNDEGSCTHFLFESFFNPLQINPERIKLFDACSEDLDSACDSMDRFIKENGPLDIMMVGVGLNGHIGLNEPGTDFNLYSHYSPLAAVTKRVGQKYFKQKTELNYGITLGLQHLKEAKMPLLIASGNNKAEIIAQALEGEVSNQLPASIFQMLSSAHVLLDKEAAKGLHVG